MAPDLLDALESAELTELAGRIQDYQKAKGLTFAALLKKFGGLGSDKTFNKILKSDLMELDAERQLANYRAVWALIESLGDDDEQGEEIYDDLGPAMHLRKAFIEAMRDGGNARFILLEGESGDGKTSAQRVLREKFGQRLMKIEATVAWNDSPLAMLGEILAGFGVKNPPLNQMLRFNQVVEKLSDRRIAIVVEEAHHMGPKLLNLTKTLINQTPGEFIFLALPTLWARLAASAYQEAKQLTGNRLADRIKIGGWSERDVRKFIIRRVPALADEAERAAKLVMPHMKANGSGAFLRETCKRAKEHGESLTMELFAAAVTAEIGSR